MRNRSLVVSVHDVSPRTQAASAEMLRQLEEIGVHHCSLLVIPNHHHQGHFLDDAAFCEWLREQAAAGHEIVAHGYFHQRPARAGESLLQRLTTRVYTAGEGEFYDLDRQTAFELAGRSVRELSDAGLAPRGFIAPAWLLSVEAEAALRDLGLAYTTRLGGVLDLQKGAFHRSQSLVWSVRSAWRRHCSLLWNRLLSGRMAREPLLRIAIHPVDLAAPAVWRQAIALAREALAGREPLTYQTWLQRQTGSEPLSAAPA